MVINHLRPSWDDPPSNDLHRDSTTQSRLQMLHGNVKVALVGMLTHLTGGKPRQLCVGRGICFSCVQPTNVPLKRITTRVTKNCTTFW